MDENAAQTTDAAAPPSERSSPRHRAALVARLLLVPYLVFVALLVFLPASGASRVTGVVWWAAQVLAGAGFPFRESAVALEFVANIALFVPVGLLARFAIPRVAPWAIIAIGCLGSTVIELVQLTIPSRFATVSDVVANTLGVAVGVGLAVAATSVARRRRGL